MDFKAEAASPQGATTKTFISNTVSFDWTVFILIESFIRYCIIVVLLAVLLQWGLFFVQRTHKVRNMPPTQGRTFVAQLMKKLDTAFRLSPRPLYNTPQMKEEHTVNDENNRRLSNGSMQPPAPATLAPAATAAAIGGDEPASPPRPLSLASPLGRSQGVRGSVESSAWGGSSWDPSVSGTGTRSVASSSAARPSFRTLSASSTVEHDRDGDDERHGFDRHRHDERLESSTEEGRPGGDCLSPLGSPASAAFAGIANADAAADAGVLASPAPGRKSKLFRRVSRLPRTSLEEFDHQDGGFGGEADEGDGSEDGKHAGGGGGGGGGALNGHTQNLVICRADSGVSSAGSGGGKCDNGGGSGGGGGGSRQFSGSGDEGGVSTDTSSVGRKGGLGKGFGEGRPRAHGRRDAVLQEMRPEPRGRGSGRDKDKEKGGPRLGAAGGAGASRSESAKERRRGKGDTPGDTGRGGVVRGEELQHRQQSRTKHRLYPNSGELRVILGAHTNSSNGSGSAVMVCVCVFFFSSFVFFLRVSGPRAVYDVVLYGLEILRRCAARTACARWVVPYCRCGCRCVQHAAFVAEPMNVCA